jgi:ribosomal protein S18 acetylase RimI-like enzyme
MSGPEIYRATAADRAQVVDTVEAAFVRDPAFRYFLGGPDDAGYPAFARAFAGLLFDKRVSSGSVWIVEGGRAVAMWDAPRTTTLSDEGVASAPYGVLAADVQERLGAYDAVVDPIRPTSPHWYLGVLARHPETAGRGWGRAVMSAGLAAAASDGVDAYLETSSPGNVALYERAGWQVAGHAQVSDLPIWVMRHS